MDFITLKKCSDISGIGHSSVRFYRDRYESYFTSQGVGRHRMYSTSTPELLLLIVKLYKEGLKYPQIIEELDKVYGMPLTTDNIERSNANAVQQDIVNDIKTTFIEEIQRLEVKVDELINSSNTHDELLMTNIRLLMARNTKRWWRFWS